MLATLIAVVLAAGAAFTVGRTFPVPAAAARRCEQAYVAGPRPGPWTRPGGRPCIAAHYETLAKLAELDRRLGDLERTGRLRKVQGGGRG